MTYGAEAIIPLETGFPTLRTSSFNPSNNNELLEKSLDFIYSLGLSISMGISWGGVPVCNPKITTISSERFAIKRKAIV